MHVENGVDAVVFCILDRYSNAVDVRSVECTAGRFQEGPRDVEPDDVEAQRCHLREVRSSQRRNGG